MRTRHGEAPAGGSSAEYRVWQGMLTRCRNPRRQNYPHYGGRGITVCAEWSTSYAAFLQDVGRRPTAHHSLDRIDNTRGYEPGNVRWATAKEQAHNTRRNRQLTARGVTLPLCDWARRLGVDRMTITRRLKLGWTVEAAVLTPPKAVGFCRQGHRITGVRCLVCQRKYARAWHQRRREGAAVSPEELE